MIEIFLLSMLLGLIAGLLAGLFGLGGGVIIVPVLVWIFSAYNFPEAIIMIMAVATSLSTIVFTSVASILTHHKLGAIKWDSVKRLSPGILLGAGFGAVVADYIEADVLKYFFVAYLLYVSIRMAWPQNNKVKVVGKITIKVGYFVGLGIGFLSSLLGIGGGTLTVPFLLSRKLAMKNAVAVSSVCGLPIAISSTVSYMVLGRNVDLLPEWSLGYIYFPALAGIIICSVFTAPIGAKLANKLPAKQLKRYFSMVLFLIAFKMILV